MATDSLRNITITTEDGTDYSLKNPFLASFSDSNDNQDTATVSLPAKAFPDEVGPRDIVTVTGTREQTEEIEVTVDVEFMSDTEGRGGATHHEFKVTDQ